MFPTPRCCRPLIGAVRSRKAEDAGMANPIHVAVVKQGIDAIQDWRGKNPGVVFDLVDADLHRISLVDGDFCEPDFWGNLSLKSADLSYARLSGADLTNGYLCIVKLFAADLRRAKLAWAYLPRADLRQANFEGADLTGVDLRNADLTGARLIGAQLAKADLHRANLSKADLRDADLSEVKNLTQRQVDVARADSSTRLPNGIQRRGTG